MTFKGLVIVSGAARGVGRSTALMLAEAGYKVIAGVFPASEIEAWQDDHVKTGRITPLPLDLTQPEQIAVFCEAALLHSPELPCALVSVAGYSQFDALELMPSQILRRMFEVNVFGALALSVALAPRLKESKGRIVFVTSMAARASAPLLGGYAATKSAMESLIDALRVELTPWGVTITILEPGGIRTEMTNEAVEHTRLAAIQCEQGKAAFHPYAAAYAAITNLVLKDAGGYLSPEAVAKALVDLVIAPKVQARYLLGNDAKLVVMLKKLIPDRWFDAVMAKQFKLTTLRGQ